MAINVNIHLALGSTPDEHNSNGHEQASQGTTSSLSFLPSELTPSAEGSRSATLQISKKRKRSQLEGPTHDSASIPTRDTHSFFARNQCPPPRLNLGEFASTPDSSHTRTIRSAVSNITEKEADENFRAQLLYVPGMLLWSEMHREARALKPKLNPVLERILYLNGWTYHGLYIDEEGVVRAGLSVGNVPSVFKEDLVGACLTYVREGKGVLWQDMPFCQPACALSVRVGYEQVATVETLSAEQSTLGIVMPMLEQVLARDQMMQVDDFGSMTRTFA